MLSLKQFNVFEIPKNIEHEVKGLEKENIFIITQELD
jgi:hypothetical protein